LTVFWRIKDYLKRSKRKIKITLPWFGEGKLDKPKAKDKPVTREEIWRDFLGK